MTDNERRCTSISAHRRNLIYLTLDSSNNDYDIGQRTAEHI